MTLYVEEEETLWAEFESGDAAEVQWSASGSSGVVKIVVDKQSPDTVTLQALKPGKITIIAKLKSDPSKSAQCVITVEE